jgi:hypothetical protein
MELFEVRNVRYIVILIGLAIPLCSSAQEEVRCDYAQRTICDRSGCKDAPVELKGNYLLVPTLDSMVKATTKVEVREAFNHVLGDDNANEKLPTIRKCGSAGCSADVVRAHLGGAFVDVKPATEGAYILRFAHSELGGIQPGDFLEVVTNFLSTITSYGSCKGVAAK